MDDYEVELIDYLRVLWWGKWIILGCLLVAVGTSALYVSFQPTTYTGSVELQLRQYVTATLGEDGTSTVMESALVTALSSLKGELRGLETTVSDDLSALSIGGSRSSNRGSATPEEAGAQSERQLLVNLSIYRMEVASPADGRRTLEKAATELEQELAVSLEGELQHLAQQTEIQKTGLLAQLDILKQKLDEQGSPDAPLSMALAEQIAALEAQLAKEQVRLDTLKSADPSDLFTINQLGEPTVTKSGPDLVRTIGIAGFLGLIIGVLLAFFAHYLIQVRAREQGSE